MNSREQGVASLLFILVLLLGIVTLFTRNLDLSPKTQIRAEQTQLLLAQAKEALIGYAVTYGDTHANQMNGYLPCPDLSGTGVGGEGAAEGVCGTTNVSSIGMLPWKTIGLPPLHDGGGECLWYAVSGTYKYNPTTDFMNWDDNGQFKVMASDGVTILAGAAADNQPVAVIFAPNVATGAQSHAPAANTPTCSDNYTASNYLDNDTIHNINNSIVSTVANAVSTFIAGPVMTAANSPLVNDQVLYITRDDIFKAIKKRTDFANGTFVSNLLGHAVSCLFATLPQPVTIDFTTTPATDTQVNTPTGNLYIGRIAKNSCGSSDVLAWRDNILYASCQFGNQCLAVNNGGIANCRGVVIFAGEKAGAQIRNTNADKNNPANYLEDVGSNNVYTEFASGGTAFNGATAYSPASPSTDLLACIP